MSDNPDNLSPDTTGSDFAVPSYDLTPEEAAAVAGIENFDPIADIPSPAKFTGGDFRVPERLTASILPPDMAAQVRADLAGIPEHRREEREHELVFEALRRNGIDLRVKGTPDPSLEPYFREVLLIEKEWRELNAEAHSIYQKLAEVSAWVPVFNEDGSQAIDPDTGQPKVRAVERYQGDARTALEARLREVEYRASLLDGIEGERRIARAMKETAQLRLAHKQAAEDRAEAEALARKMVREERIHERAIALAKRMRTEDRH
jgi:hypothetical protein